MIAALKALDREKWADGLATAVAVSLPWSTSATSILTVLWLIVLVPTLNVPLMRRTLAVPAGGLPVLLFLLAVLGTLWAFGVPFKERIDGLTSFSKLLVIPLLVAQFQRSGRGVWVLYGFLASCVALLAVSWFLLLGPPLPASFHKTAGVPVKDYISQDSEFTICIFLLAPLALMAWQQRRRSAAVLLVLLILAFLANVFDVGQSRTALVVIPVLALILATKQLTWKAGLSLLAAVAIAAGVALSFAPGVRDNLSGMLSEVRDFTPAGPRTRAGERLEFWRKSIGFLQTAPLIGHGTGSIRAQFRSVAAGGDGSMAALASANPHNQTFAVAIQLGLLGTVALFAMWLAHAMMFRGEGLAAWTGLAIVAQNVAASLFNSHLFDFTQGWGYVFGVGVAAGMMLKQTRPG